MPSDRPKPKPESPHYHGHRDRLRERLLTHGAAALADYELLELILFGAKARGDTKPEAKALIARFGSLGGVLRAGPEALTEIPGIGETSAALLKAVAAAMERVLAEQVMDRPVLGSWQKLLDYCAVTMGHAQIESFRLLFLDVKNALIRDEVQQTGTIDHTPVYPREVIKRALELGAAAFIMVHNHPSGDPTPSRADIDMTREVAKAAAVVGIQLHDHLIIGRGGKHASLKAMGLI